MSAPDGSGGAGKGKGGPSAVLTKPAPLPPWPDALAAAPDVGTALSAWLPGVFETMKYMAQEADTTATKLSTVEQAVVILQSEVAQTDSEAGRMKGICTDLDLRLAALQSSAAAVAASHQQYLLDAGARILNDEAIIDRMKNEVGEQIALQRDQLELVVGSCKLELDALKHATGGLQQQLQQQSQQLQQQSQ